jgi:hypothetical protein
LRSNDQKRPKWRSSQLGSVRLDGGDQPVRVIRALGVGHVADIPGFSASSGFTILPDPFDLAASQIVEGGVRRAANRVRITTQLIDATTGAHLCADRSDGTLEDI